MKGANRLAKCVVVIVCAITMVGSSKVALASHSKPWNDYEKYAKTGQGRGLGDNPSCRAYPYIRNIGATWLSDSADNPAGTKWEGGDGNVINVAYGQTERTVYVFGSIYGCAGSESQNNVAVNVTSLTPKYLTINGTRLERGSNSRGTFSSPKKGLPAKLNTSFNILPNVAGATRTITVKVYRCYDKYNTAAVNCGISYIPITLHRDAPPWTASAKSEVKTNQSGETGWKVGQNAHQNIRPGMTATWRHTVSNTSDTKAPNVITATVAQASPRLNHTVSGWVDKSTVRKKGGPAHGTIYTTQPTYNITQNDVDKRICQRIGWNPLSGTSAASAWGHSSAACITVPYHYPPENPDDPDDPDGGPDDPGQQPTNGVNVSTTVSADTVLPGEDVEFTYKITNQKGPTKTKSIKYRTYTFIVPGNGDLPSNWEHMVTYGMSWSEVDCSEGGRDVYGRTRCTSEWDKQGTTDSINPPHSWTDSSLYNISGDWVGNPGDRICSYIAVDNNWSIKNGVSSTSYAASNIACARIGKRPQVQMNGSDSYAGAGFYSSAYSSISLNNNRGSYSQYGLLTGSTAPITNFGSAGYTANASVNACKLAFANTGSITSSCSGMTGLGNAGIDRALAVTATIPNGVLANPITSDSISINGLSNGYHRRSGSLTISGGSLSSGVRATIVVNGDVTIAGNIGDSSSESTPYSSLAQMPSLTIIATGNVKVNGSVTLINANLVSTGGKFISCAESSASNGVDSDLGIHDGAMCKNKLKVNGSVVSKQSPVLHRTFGSGNENYINQWDNNTITATSEWFNYTPNVWLVPYLGGGSGTPDGYNTVNVTGLPVRY